MSLPEWHRAPVRLGKLSRILRWCLHLGHSFPAHCLAAHLRQVKCNGSGGVLLKNNGFASTAQQFLLKMHHGKLLKTFYSIYSAFGKDEPTNAVGGSDLLVFDEMAWRYGHSCT